MYVEDKNMIKKIYTKIHGLYRISEYPETLSSGLVAFRTSMPLALRKEVKTSILQARQNSTVHCSTVDIVIFTQSSKISVNKHETRKHYQYFEI